MDMIRIHSGKLRAIGYDASKRILRVELEDGRTLEHLNVGESLWRSLKNASAQWSYYRDNIEDEFTVNRVSNKAPSGKNPLDDLFGPT
ncbi:KTSC domain-containing protein [Methylophilus methylotrophus]|uniref:KTSC domain-containing protein n=1 Tax=Methylophilus methylotrophus TaxID=17 RepID=UPI0003659D3D|nr:KTSC domain-containing protein [Methylophilus methylotrophus]